jgi:hypothetical protein
MLRPGVLSREYSGLTVKADRSPSSASEIKNTLDINLNFSMRLYGMVVN